MEAITKKTEWGAFITGLLPLFVLAHFGHHLLTALPIPLSPMIRSDFSLDYTFAGLVISAFNLAYGIGQLPGGWLADRFGPRIMREWESAGSLWRDSLSAFLRVSG